MEFFRIGSMLRVDTHAKLNLFLEVLAKRADGFHEIETLMTAISLCDTLFVTGNSEGRIRLHCRWAGGMAARRESTSGDAFGELPCETDNIVYKAADRLRGRAAASNAGATIELIKRIPSAAGLGGASSDAAAALVALNKVWRLALSPAQLSELASEVGSDVPFFLSGTRSGAQVAICRGRGERIEPLAGVTPLHFVVAKPPAGLSTAAVYGKCAIPPFPENSDRLRNALRCGDPVAVGRSLFNRLQETAEQLCPWIRRLRCVFEGAGVLGHQMSGSGSSYFGICRNRRQARQVATRLRGLGAGEVVYAITRPAW